MPQANTKLIVALDVDNSRKAMTLVNLLKPRVGIFKVGLQLFVAEGPALVRRIRRTGCEVFLDLKLHDIPHQVAGAVERATRLGAAMITLHALGGWEMLYLGARTAEDAATRFKVPKPKLLGVTVLTSLDETQLELLGIHHSMEQEVHRLACIAEYSGLDGIVASPREVKFLRHSGFEELLIVTPGVRPAHSATQDQVRVMTPRNALEAGADYLVVGRPILQANDPLQAAEGILEEMSAAGNR